VAVLTVDPRSAAQPTLPAQVFNVQQFSIDRAMMPAAAIADWIRLSVWQTEPHD
jgi:hypothetical protein